jgi:hypothetical protein
LKNVSAAVECAHDLAAAVQEHGLQKERERRQRTTGLLQAGAKAAFLAGGVVAENSTGEAMKGLARAAQGAGAGAAVALEARGYLQDLEDKHRLDDIQFRRKMFRKISKAAGNVPKYSPALKNKLNDDNLQTATQGMNRHGMQQSVAFGQRNASKGGKGYRRASGSSSGPAPPPLDHPEKLPALTRLTREQVAFQAQSGTPWKVLGPEGGTLCWDAQDREAVSEAVKQEVRDVLQSYARENGIPLQGDLGVKLALRRGDYWISYAGGISSGRQP